MKIRCTDNEGVERYVSNGAIYEVIDDHKSTFHLEGDNGITVGLSKIRFEIVKEEVVERSPMTQEEYVAVEGARCPYCRSNNTSGDSFENGDNQSWQKISCDDCGKSWNALYKLIGWEPL